MAKNTTKSEDRVISQCVAFGGVAEELATITQWLDDKLSEANDQIIDLKAQVKELEERQ